MSKLLNIKDSIQRIQDLLKQGSECLISAGKIVAREIDNDPNWVEYACEANKRFTPELIYRLEAVGRGVIHPELAFDTCRGASEMRKLPFHLQEKHISNPIPVLILNGESILVDYHNLTPEQTKQVFDNGKIRNESAQRAWIETQNMKKSKPVISINPFEIRRGCLVVSEPCQFTKDQLIQLLSQMAK